MSPAEAADAGPRDVYAETVEGVPPGLVQTLQVGFDALTMLAWILNGKGADDAAADGSMPARRFLTWMGANEAGEREAHVVWPGGDDEPERYTAAAATELRERIGDLTEQGYTTNERLGSEITWLPGRQVILVELVSTDPDRSYHALYETRDAERGARTLGYYTRSAGGGLEQLRLPPVATALLHAIGDCQ